MGESGARADGRHERSRRTRSAIARAAAVRFVADGYVGTTIAAIADDAGVSQPTVYASFGTKAAVLAAALDLAIAGDDRPVAVNERPWMQYVWTAPSAGERLTAYAAAVRRIHVGAGDLFAVVAAARGVDPDATELARVTEARRRAGATAVIDSVRQVGRLRRGLTRAEAIDVLSMLNGPAAFRHLVRESGWSPARYEKWLAGALVRELLAS